jgi:dUTP pyrophosphatase
VSIDQAAGTEVLFSRVPEGRDLPAPERATAQAAGFDLRARVDGSMELLPGARGVVPSGIAIALPPGFEAQVRPRSGLAMKHGLSVINAPGTVDSDYRGEIRVLLINLGDEPVRIRRGDRIAQLVVQRLPEIVLRETPELPRTVRGTGGFGHTGDR